MHINGQLHVQTCGAQFKRYGVPPGKISYFNQAPKSNGQPLRKKVVR